MAAHGVRRYTNLVSKPLPYTVYHRRDRETMAIEAHETQLDVLDISATQPIGHDAKRTFQSFPGSQYVLPSDAVEKDRSEWFSVLRCSCSG